MTRNLYGRRPARPTALQQAIQLSPTTFKTAERAELTPPPALFSPVSSPSATRKNTPETPASPEANITSQVVTVTESPSTRSLRSSPRRAATNKVYTSRKRTRVEVQVPIEEPLETGIRPIRLTKLPNGPVIKKGSMKESSSSTIQSPATIRITRSSTESPKGPTETAMKSLTLKSSTMSPKFPKVTKSSKRAAKEALQAGPKLIRSRKSENPAPKSPLLNSFFVESQTKPTWSPSKTPQSSTSSPLPNSASPLNPKINSSRVSSLTEKLQSLSKEPTSPKATLSTGWDFLDDLDDDPIVKPRTTIVKKVSLRSPRKEKPQQDRQELLQFFESSEFRDKTDEQTEQTPSLPPSPSKLQRSPRFGSMQRGTYGAQRSYLAERLNNDDGTTPIEEDDQSDDEDTDDKNEENLRSITNLRAQGESAKFLDDFNFIIDGIENKPCLFSFLELAMRLFQDDFLRFVKTRGLPNLQHMVDKKDVAAVYVLGFILCKVADQTHCSGVLDDSMIEIVKTLLEGTPKFTLKKESKSVRIMFKEFTDRLGVEYNTQFVAVTLLLQAGLFLSDDLLPGLVKILADLDLTLQTHLKLYHMILLLLESHLSGKETVPKDFDYVYDFISKNTHTTSQTDLLQLKLIIVLAVKKFEKVFDPALFIKFLKATLARGNKELQLLNIGLLISLVEDPKCLQVAMRQENIQILHTLYSVVSDDSIPYFSLLVGTLYAESQLKIRKVFHTAELDRIVLELQRFDKVDRLMSLQVQNILAQLST